MNKSQLLEHLERQGFPKHILKAFEKIKREDFIPEDYKEHAYDDNPIPLGYGATTSQPYTIAFMLDKLELKENKNQKILEIGSGSGYVLALLQEITKGKIYGVEIIKALADQSKKVLKNNKNIKIIHKSGKNGSPENTPYDKILISASCSEIPKHLTKQLKDNGIIVASVQHSLVKIKKQKDKVEIKEFPGFVFVPLVDK